MSVNESLCQRWHLFCQSQNKLRTLIHKHYNGIYPLNNNRIIETKNHKHVDDFLASIQSTEDSKIAQAYQSYSDIFKQTYICTQQTKSPNYRMYHMNPVVPSKRPPRHDMMTFNHFDVLKSILENSSSFQPKTMKKADDREILKMKFNNVPVILKRQEASTGNQKTDLLIKQKMYDCFVNQSNDPYYIDKIYSLLDRNDIESLTEVYNGTIMNNMNAISPIFPYLYHAAFDFILDDQAQTITPYVVQIQEFLGESLQDLIDKINKDSIGNAGLNQLNFVKKNKIYETMIMQILFAFMTAQRIMDFVHFDLRLPNITFERTDQTHINYNVDGVLYTVPTHGMLFHVIDFGRSYVNTGQMSTGTDMYITDMRTRSRTIDGKKLDYADLLLFTREFLYRGDTLFVDETNKFTTRNNIFYSIMKDSLICDGDFKNIYPESFDCDKNLSMKLEQDGFEKPFSNFYSCVINPNKYEKLRQLRTKTNPADIRSTLTKRSLDYQSNKSGSFAAFHPFTLSKNCSQFTSVKQMIHKYGKQYVVDFNDVDYVLDNEEIVIV